MGGQRRYAVGEFGHHVPGQHQQDTRGLGPHRTQPQRVGLPDRLVAHLVAVGDDPEDLLLVVLAGGVAGEAAVRDQVGLGDGLSGLEQDLAGPHLTDPEAARDLLQDLRVGVPAQHRQFGERLGDDLDVVGAVLLELHPAAADAELEPPVDPVGTAPHVHPGQHLQQPSRGDGLHLRFGLGRRGELAGRHGAEAGELPVAGVRGVGFVGGGTGGAFRSGHFPSREVNRGERVVGVQAKQSCQRPVTARGGRFHAPKGVNPRSRRRAEQIVPAPRRTGRANTSPA